MDGADRQAEGFPVEPRVEATLLRARIDMPFKLAKRSLLDSFEREYLIASLRDHAMNLSATSRSIGVSRKHLRQMMYKHGLVLERRLLASHAHPTYDDS